MYVLSPSSAVSAAMLRTTIAPTMIEGSPKENILPQRASAFVNFRVHPNDTMESVLAHVERAVADPMIEVSQSTRSFSRDASPMASKESAGYKLIAKTIGDIYGSILVSPGMTVGGTDSKHYQAIADETYRFAPMTLPPADARGFHGTNERVRVANMDDMVRFYIQLVKNADENR
ncbi:MAG: M20/M25/M40 family metallo-hydrolase [Myxococcota bacterium]|nr:M20/M25/M40 family metallo-hydrolase [Myxococcota bacterium]